MLLRAALVAGLASLALATPAGAASATLTPPGFAALSAVLKSADDPAVVTPADLRKACTAIAASDAQSRLLRRNCTTTADLAAGAVALLDCPTGHTAAKIVACARTERKRINASAARSSALERRLAAQVTGGCHAYFRASIADNTAIAAYYTALVDNLVTPGSVSAAKLAKLQAKLQTTPADTRAGKRNAAACDPLV